MQLFGVRLHLDVDFYFFWGRKHVELNVTLDTYSNTACVNWLKVSKATVVDLGLVIAWWILAEFECWIYTLNQLNLVCVISHSLDRLFYVCKSTQNIYHDQSKYNLNQMLFSNLWIISHQILFIWITLILRGWTLVGTPI